MSDDPSTVSYASPLVDLLCKHARLGEAIDRTQVVEEARHYYLDTCFVEVALQEGWTREAIHTVLNTAHARVMRPPLPENRITLLLHEAALRQQIGHLDGAREALLEHVSKNWQIDIVQVIRHGKENSVWSLKLLDGTEVKLGSSEDLLKQNKVRAAIFDVTGKVIPQMTGKKSAEWDAYLQTLANVAVTVDTPELPRKGYVLGLINQYLDHYQCLLTRDSSEEELQELVLMKKPFVRQGGLYVNAPNLHQFCHLIAPDLKRETLLDLLRHIGGQAIKVNCYSKTAPRTSRSYWCLQPLSLFDEESPGLDIAPVSVNGTTDIVYGAREDHDA